MPPKDEGRLPIWSWMSEHVSDPTVAIETTDPIVSREAVMAGLGIGILSEFDAVGRHDLTSVLPSHLGWDVPVWLVTHRELRTSPRIRAVFDTLAQGLREIGRT